MGTLLLVFPAPFHPEFLTQLVDKDDCRVPRAVVKSALAAAAAAAASNPSEQRGRRVRSTGM